MESFIPPVRHDPIRLAVLISGGGTTLANFAARLADGRLKAEVALVIASNDRAAEKIKAKGLDYPVQVVRRKDHDTTEGFSDVVFDRVRKADVDLVCLAGFLSLLAIPDDFAGRVLNIHPALLPSFGGQGMYGHHVHEAVLEKGCKVSGCTVHFADQAYDRGPILIQRCCEVKSDDTADSLAARVFEQECEAYPEAISLIAQSRVKLQNGRANVQ